MLLVIRVIDLVADNYNRHFLLRVKIFLNEVEEINLLIGIDTLLGILE